MIFSKKFSFICLILFLGLKPIFSQVAANFTADTLSGCSPVYVTFTNLSTPSTGVSFFWDFGNGVTSTLKNPSNLYINSGFYNVKLIVSDGIDADTLIKTNYITIYKPPKAKINYTGQYFACLPHSANFSDASTIGDAPIKYQLWNFGDGTYTDMSNPSHTFTDQGSFQISYFISDDNGCSDYVFLQNPIKTSKIEADFSVDNNFSCADSLKVNFLNLSTGDSITNFTWNFGDSHFSNDTNPKHTYSETGIFTVSLIIKNQAGCIDTAIQEDFISHQNVKAFFYVPARISCANSPTNFISTSSNAQVYHWNFGDGQTSSEDTVVHKYAKGGIYLANLVVSNFFGCTDSYSRNIYVDSINAKFSTNKNFICQLPDTIHYINESTNANSYEWHFANGNTSTVQNPENIINQEGIFSDTLIARNSSGCSDTYIFKNAIKSTIPKAYFIPNNLVNPFKIMGCVPNTVDFKDVSKYNVANDSIISWDWNFGDGQSSNLQNPSHIFTTLDTFFVQLKVTSLLGCSSEYNAFAFTGTPQHADFTFNIPDTICASDPMTFINLSQDVNLINLNYWIFSDSTYSLDNNPIHYNQDTGYVNVLLLTYYNGCFDDTTINKITYVKGPFQKIEANYDCSTPFSPTLAGNIKSSTKFFWDFNDGSDLDSINQNPQHLFPSRGVYNVTLSSENNLTGCSYSIEKDINIYSAKANFIVNDTTMCLGQTANFNSGSSLDEHTFMNNDSSVVYLWNFGENDYNSLDSIISHKFSIEGNFNVKMKIRDARSCEDSTEQIIYVHNPHSNFSADKINGCIPLNVNFTNNTSSYFPIIYHKWSFGDAHTSLSENPSNLYLYKGNYDVRLISKDNNGCVDTLKKINFINTEGPIPNFHADKTKICLTDEIKFSFSSQVVTITDILWDFGDGNTSHDETPIHIYSNAGIYNVSLTLFTDTGCDSTKIIANYISVQQTPIADFNADVLSSTCYPLFVNFYDNSASADINYYKWNLGGNVISYLKNPSYIYLKPGDYDISLTVKTSNGCANTKTLAKLISIKGPYAEIIAHDTICKNISTDFKMKNQSNIEYSRWFFGDGGTSNNTSANYTFANSGYFTTYLLLKSDSSGTCTKYFTKTILVRDVKSGFIIDSFAKPACPPFEFKITDTTAYSYSRTWDFGDSFTDISKTVYHTYQNQGDKNITLYEKDSYGCIDTITQILTINPIPNISIIQDTFICKGQQIQFSASGASVYSWTPQNSLNNPFISNPIANPEYTTTYTLTAKNDKECEKTKTTTITVIQQPTFSINDTSIVIGDTVFLNNYFDNIASYFWSPSDGLTCFDCSKPLAAPLVSTYYTLTISDTANCFEISKSIFIEIMKKYSLDVPTAFTPNGDGVNDIIFVDGWGIKEVLFFNIYNRYGELVFSSNKIYNGWDGNYKGAPQPIETYRYNVSIISYDGSTLSKSGTIKLIR